MKKDYHEALRICTVSACRLGEIKLAERFAVRAESNWLAIFFHECHREKRQGRQLDQQQ